MSRQTDEAVAQQSGTRWAIGAILLALPLFGVAALLSSAAGARSDTHAAAKRVAAVATMTTSDFRVAVVAQRLTGGGAAPPAEVRVAVAERVKGAWRERRELRLGETYFWRTVIGPRAVCRLEMVTARSPRAVRPRVIVRLLQSPSLGCGPAHLIAIPAR